MTKRSFYGIMLLASIVVTLGSCLGHDDDYVYYDDAAITSFTLTAANEYTTTTGSDGKVSTTKTELTPSSYRFHINQVSREIYNTDSLPSGTDSKHILVSIVTKMGGTIYLKSMKSDSLSVYSSNDSIDFSQPRTFYVLSHSGKVRSQYLVKVNVHRQDGEKTGWSTPGTAEPAKEYTEGMKMAAAGGRMFLFGNNGTATEGCATDLADGKTWTPLTPNIEGGLDAEAYKSLTAQGEKLYIMSSGKLYSSADGENWDEVATTTMKQLLGATPSHLYALTAEGTIETSDDGGKTWTAEQVDGDASMLPTRDISLCYNKLVTNENAYQVIIIGNGDDDNPSKARIWGKIEENDEYAQPGVWTSLGDYDGNMYPAPALSGLHTVAYDKGFIALGGHGLGTFEAEPFGNIYKSVDGGLSWRTDHGMTLPTEFSFTSDTFAMTADDANNIWIVCGQSGQVWRGRLNRLGWDEND